MSRDMENIFYAVLALHTAGKSVNKEDIKAVLKAANTPANEPALGAMSAFVEALEAAQREKEKDVDPRILKFPSSELAQQKVQTKQLEDLLKELSKSTHSAPKAISPEARTFETGEEIPATSGKVSGEKTTKKAAKTVQGIISTQDKGRYVYGIAANNRTVRLGLIGIEGNEVYTTPYKELCAIVHNCPAEPYQSNDGEIVKNWVRTHQSVLDEAKKRFGTIIPLGFDTILKPKDDVTSSDQVVRDWLKEDYDRLGIVMGKIEGKDEYGVQISYEPNVIGKQISEQSEEVKKIKEEIATKSPGMAYLYKQKLEKAVKAEVERLASEWFKDFYRRTKYHCSDIIVEKTKKVDKNKVMLLNFACLVAREEIDSMGEELEKINNMEGFSVHFSGPWPPYSFVAKPTTLAKEE